MPGGSGSLVPVVDFTPWNLERADQPMGTDMDTLVEKVHQAFKDIGFVYLTNTGIPQTQLDRVRGCMDSFFMLSRDVKSQYARRGDENHGYVAMEQESLNPERPGDLKECYNVTPHRAKIWPDKDVPGYKATMMELHGKCCHLADRVLKVMAMGLGMKDQNTFSSKHNYCRENPTTLRCLYYPPVPTGVKPGQIRCGEHSDYGSITVLFQDSIGGLQVRNPAGEYIPAPTIPGGVLINIGDLMQRWTADTYVSTKHRVVIPGEEMLRCSPRYSVAFFTHPDDDVIVSCFDGSEKYPPISGLDYLKMRFNATY